MLELIIGAIIGIILGSIIFDSSPSKFEKDALCSEVKYYKQKTDDYRTMVINKQNEYSKLLMEYNEIVTDYNALLDAYKKLKNSNKPHSNIKFNNNLDQDLIRKAIKKAMMDAHPDRGGNAEEFMKYKAMYDKVKGA